MFCIGGDLKGVGERQRDLDRSAEIWQGKEESESHNKRQIYSQGRALRLSFIH